VKTVKQYYVYIMASRSRALYTGVTNDLVKRVFEHKNKLIKGFTKKYNVINLVYYEVADDAQAAIQREKQVKGWLRKKKIALIEAMNPEWKDLSDRWYKT
jgi:putative endonuclease